MGEDKVPHIIIEFETSRAALSASQCTDARWRIVLVTQRSFIYNQYLHIRELPRRDHWKPQDHHPTQQLPSRADNAPTDASLAPTPRPSSFSAAAALPNSNGLLNDRKSISTTEDPRRRQGVLEQGACRTLPSKPSAATIQQGAVPRGPLAISTAGSSPVNPTSSRSPGLPTPTTPSHPSVQPRPFAAGKSAPAGQTSNQTHPITPTTPNHPCDTPKSMLPGSAPARSPTAVGGSMATNIKVEPASKPNPPARSTTSTTPSGSGAIPGLSPDTPSSSVPSPSSSARIQPVSLPPMTAQGTPTKPIPLSAPQPVESRPVRSASLDVLPNTPTAGRAMKEDPKSGFGSPVAPPAMQRSASLALPLPSSNGVGLRSGEQNEPTTSQPTVFSAGFKRPVASVQLAPGKMQMRPPTAPAALQRVRTEPPTPSAPAPASADTFKNLHSTAQSVVSMPPLASGSNIPTSSASRSVGTESENNSSPHPTPASGARSLGHVPTSAPTIAPASTSSASPPALTKSKSEPTESTVTTPIKRKADSPPEGERPAIMSKPSFLSVSTPTRAQVESELASWVRNVSTITSEHRKQKKELETRLTASEAQRARDQQAFEAEKEGLRKSATEMKKQYEDQQAQAKLASDKEKAQLQISLAQHVAQASRVQHTHREMETRLAQVQASLAKAEEEKTEQISLAAGHAKSVEEWKQRCTTATQQAEALQQARASEAASHNQAISQHLAQNVAAQNYCNGLMQQLTQAEGKVKAADKRFEVAASEGATLRQRGDDLARTLAETRQSEAAATTRCKQLEQEQADAKSSAQADKAEREKLDADRRAQDIEHKHRYEALEAKSGAERKELGALVAQWEAQKVVMKGRCGELEKELEEARSRERAVNEEKKQLGVELIKLEADFNSRSKELESSRQAISAQQAESKLRCEGLEADLANWQQASRTEKEELEKATTKWKEAEMKLKEQCKDLEMQLDRSRQAVSEEKLERQRLLDDHSVQKTDFQNRCGALERELEQSRHEQQRGRDVMEAMRKERETMEADLRKRCEMLERELLHTKAKGKEAQTKLDTEWTSRYEALDEKLAQTLELRQADAKKIDELQRMNDCAYLVPALSEAFIQIDQVLRELAGPEP
ncbi:hypothetical protein BOTBODRAFT_51500 [Botryobasidium botryosum FD-172 SS1]|uniref:Uncharacterized protein n=1 Tax=Botryobasidium botryosum (strain FD-172 SS1) TaxID=930990 RepID=A0A067MWP3_BOTB1|nr:hypothetical protein BOTBODRAFT_51500 [Botryobasidium botryosum FD-172 SS1]